MLLCFIYYCAVCVVPVCVCSEQHVQYHKARLLDAQKEIAKVDANLAKLNAVCNTLHTTLHILCTLTHLILDTHCCVVLYSHAIYMLFVCMYVSMKTLAKDPKQKKTLGLLEEATKEKSTLLLKTAAIEADIAKLNA